MEQYECARRQNRLVRLQRKKNSLRCFFCCLLACAVSMTAAAALRSQLCLVGDSNGLTPTPECQDLTKQFVCRMLYAPCDPAQTPAFPKPICGDFCVKLSKCVTYSTCKKAFETLLTCVPPALPPGWHSGTHFSFCFFGFAGLIACVHASAR